MINISSTSIFASVLNEMAEDEEELDSEQRKMMHSTHSHIKDPRRVAAEH